MRVRSRRLRTGVRVAALLALVGGLLPAVQTAATAPAQAAFGISQRKGIDGCSFSNNTQTHAFWAGTPYYNLGIYLGGIAYGQGCSLLDASEISFAVNTDGWEAMFLWVGRQPPCTQISAPTFSSNTTTARSQGADEAVQIYQRLNALGLDTLNTPVIYDFEPWNTGSSSCVAAVRAFVGGFVAQMHLPPAQKAGFYGSSCASGIYLLTGASPVPDFITGAAWSTGTTSTKVLPCVSSSSWTNHQRHKQYRGGHSETWNGVTVQVDNDCSDAPIYPGPDELDNGQGCI